MKKIFIISVPVIAILVLGECAARAGTFEQCNLQPAVCMIEDNRMESFMCAWAVLKKNDARALHAFPPQFILFRLPAGFDESVLDALPVEIVRSIMNVASERLDPVQHRLIHNFFNEEGIVSHSGHLRAHTVNDLLLTVPDDIRASYMVLDSRVGAPREIAERGMQQNTEFMLGTILVNVIFPESDGGSEDWTDDELADAISGIVLGMYQYQQNALWIDPLRMDFVYNYYTRVPVSIEPIEGDRNTDPAWMAEALASLGYSPDMWETHTLNNDTRIQFGTDWVFTAFVVDASYNECWQGPGGTYYAYGYLGGPLMVIPFPTCGWNDLVGFMHVFTHEVGHIFWALDEYINAGFTCDDRSGYLYVPTRNTRYQPCEDPLQPCIMNNDTLELPLPVCTYTLGQIGISDENENAIADIYEIAPEWDFVEIQQVTNDTIYDDAYSVQAVVSNDAVPNMNPYQNPSFRVDYAPWLVDGLYRIGGGPPHDLVPVDSVWDESSEELDFLVSGFAPGLNTLSLSAENCAGLKTQVQRDIYYVSTILHNYSVTLRETYIEVCWELSEYQDGSTFYIFRAELPNDDFIEMRDPPIIREGLTFTFEDRDCKPGAAYRYRVGAVDGTERIVLFESSVVTIPVLALTLYQNYPNPFNPSTQIKYYIPAECAVTLDVHDSSGKLIRRLLDKKYTRPGFHADAWNGFDERGSAVSSGIYFYRLTAGKVNISRKMVLLR